MRAHEDPPGCNETGASINVGIFRDAGATVPLTGAVSPCEIIYYRAVLTTAPPQTPGDTVCAFSGGQFDFKTPNGTVTVISADVPCVGATVGSAAENCVAGLTSLIGPVIQYTVNPADVSGGLIAALSTYGITGGPGVAHDGVVNTPGVSQTSPKQTSVLSCDDSNACTTDVCDMPLEHGAAGCSHTTISCDDGNACTADGCNPASGCFHTDISAQCDDQDACTTDSCNPETGCVHTPIVCNDGNACTADSCDPATGCVHSAISCDDSNACTIDGCSAETGCTHSAVTCNDGNACTDDSCDPASGCVHTDNSANCDDNNQCTTDGCNPETGCTHNTINCDDGDPCTDDSCDPQSGCTHAASNDPACAPSGCRVTGGGIAPDGSVDLNEFADIINAYHGGQVGAPCGCVGCFDDGDHVQGNWTHQRKKQKGNFHADDFHSLVCGCVDLEGNPMPLDGNLCGDRETGPLPRKAPANAICFTGTGGLKRGGPAKEVAFRVDIIDRGEPGGGQNVGPSPDYYRIRMWVPKGQETLDSLLAGACCSNTNPTGDAARGPDIDDGGDVTHGNLQIHPQIPAHVGICPVPAEACPAN